MIRRDFLDRAAEAVCVTRADDHGDAREGFTLLGEIWGARLGRPIPPHMVAIMMADLKTVRAQFNPEHEDNWIDASGYAALGGEISTEPPLDEQLAALQACDGHTLSATGDRVGEAADQSPYTIDVSCLGLDQK